MNDHLSKLKRVFIRLRGAQPKVNAHKPSFCATETEFLGYVLFRVGIKLHKNRVYAILAFMPSKVSKSYIDSLAWSNTTETSGHDKAKGWLHYPL
jgi:hypothetical protein